MEKLKVKHDHKLTDIIKVAIFALFLILPILVFLPNCLYYGFNEHATNTETTTINYKYESNEVNSYDDFVLGNIYEVDNLYLTNDSFQFRLYIYKCSYLSLNGNGISTDDYGFEYFDINDASFVIDFDENVSWFEIYFSGGFFSYSFTTDDEIEFTDLVFGIQDNLEGFIDFNEASGTHATDYRYTDYNVIKSVEVNTDDTITDKVATAWGRMWETPMLSWTDTNTFKFTINAFVNVFGITQESYLANYLTYILVITCIYLIFDIVLTLTTKLTHLINEK